MSFTIALSSNEAILHSNFNPPIYLDSNSDYVIGLTNFETFNAIPNIDETNNKIYYGSGGDFIKIPSGSYEIGDLNTYLKDQFKKENIDFELKANNNTLQSEITSSADIIFKDDTFGKILGFKNQTIKGDSKKFQSDFPAEIIKVNSLNIDCSIAEGSYLNGRPVHIIHQFFPTVPPGFKIIESPQNIIYFPVTVKVIDKITLRILDQFGDLVNFRKETVTIRLHVKKLNSNGYSI